MTGPSTHTTHSDGVTSSKWLGTTVLEQGSEDSLDTVFHSFQRENQIWLFRRCLLLKSFIQQRNTSCLVRLHQMETRVINFKCKSFEVKMSHAFALAMTIISQKIFLSRHNAVSLYSAHSKH